MKKTSNSAKPVAEQKTARIDIRITQKLKQALLAEAEARGISETAYVLQLIEGRRPLPPMTDGQMAAVNVLAAARSDLVHISNVLKGRTQQERKVLFRNEKFMRAWIDGVNAVIKCLDRIIKMFLG